MVGNESIKKTTFIEESIVKEVCVITTTRADYGLLRPLILEIKKSEKLELRLVVSGTHLSSDHGSTISEIETDGITEITKFYIFQDIEKGENNTTSIMANALVAAGDYLKGYHPDVAVVYGDRYEMLAFAIAFANAKIPLIHICGGETTEGSLDEIYRHSLTKISNLHFVNCDMHRKRVIQMGENPERVYNVGDTCVDNIMSTKLLSEGEIRKYVHAPGKMDIVLVTYHPVTLELETVKKLDNMLSVIEKHDEFYYVFTKANADFEGDIINDRLGEFVTNHQNTTLVDSLGMLRYLSLLKIAKFMLGNSSSGLTEAPLFHIPTINVGNRQKNRCHGGTVIDCNGDIDSIAKAFDIAMNHEFRETCLLEESILGDGHAAEKMVHIIENQLEEGINTEKSFYNIDFEVDGTEAHHATGMHKCSDALRKSGEYSG